MMSISVQYIVINCRSHYLPREFSAILFVAVYLPPQTDAGTKTALSAEISKPETTHPEAALLKAGDFNAGKLKSVLLISFLGENILDHLYSTHTYKDLPRPPFGKSGSTLSS
jgi:hypothetical protein